MNDYPVKPKWMVRLDRSFLVIMLPLVFLLLPLWILLWIWREIKWFPMYFHDAWVEAGWKIYGEKTIKRLMKEAENNG